MCVIIYKPIGVSLPSQELLQAAAQTNPDGCGMVSTNCTYKGLSPNRLIKAVQKCSEMEPILIHFRLATQGSIRRKNCHPFYDAETKTFFMHNGIMLAPDYKDMTDSEWVFRKIFVPCIKKHGLHSQKMKEVIRWWANGSRLAFMQNGNVATFGDFDSFYGLKLSNKRFLYHNWGVQRCFFNTSRKGY